MWYVSCERWVIDKNQKKHFYNIKYRTSKDGINWDNDTKTCINYSNKYEYAIARPSVIRHNDDTYRMWYCYRASEKIDNYRIGYAVSNDGVNWDRRDNQAGINVSDFGWDCNMICYPRVFKHDDDFYMLYNGNEYGKTGFGLAKLKGNL